MRAYVEGLLITMENRASPYAEKFIKNINSNDFKVSVSGIVISKTENSFRIDDGTGQARVVSSEMPSHDYLRVFGKVMPVEDGFEIQADVVQDMSNVNKALHKKVKTLLS